MNFLNPLYFWVMLGLIPLVAIYFLKVRPRKKPVSAFFLWEKLFDEKRSTNLFQKLRDLLSLLLMILVFVSIVLALTGPVFKGKQLKSLLIIVDNSASMNAESGSGTRLDEAKSLAKKIIRGLNQNQRGAVASMSLDIRYMSHFTTSPRTLIDAVSKIESSDCPFQKSALDLSFSSSQMLIDSNSVNNQSQLIGEDYRVLLISDGCGIDSNLPEFVELFKIGDKRDNVGLIACDLQRIESISLDNSQRNESLELYFQIASSANQPINADLLVQYGPNRITKKLIPLEIQPGINQPEQYIINNVIPEYEDINKQPCTWAVQIDYDDALDKDNIACMVVPPKCQIRVKVDSNDSYFLEHSVMAFSQTSGDLLLTDSQPDIILAGGMPSENGNSIVFNPTSSEGWWGQFGESLENILPRILIKDHPIIENCDIESIPFVGAKEVNLPEDCLVLAENADHVPLIYRVRDGDKSAVIFNMNLKDSDFYYSTWFPVLIYNAARNLMGESERIASTYPIGSAISIPIAQNDEPLEVSYDSWKQNNESNNINSSGQNANEKIDKSDSQFVVSNLGYYTFSSSSDQKQIGSCLLNKSETLINNNIQGTTFAINRGMPPSFYLSIFAFLVLITESLLYHRRKVG